jgi:hypothetical protein
MSKADEWMTVPMYASPSVLMLNDTVPSCFPVKKVTPSEKSVRSLSVYLAYYVTVPTRGNLIANIDQANQTKQWMVIAEVHSLNIFRFLGVTTRSYLGNFVPECCVHCGTRWNPNTGTHFFTVVAFSVRPLPYVLFISTLTSSSMLTIMEKVMQAFPYETYLRI